MGSSKKQTDIKIHSAAIDYYIPVACDNECSLEQLYNSINTWVETTVNNYCSLQEALFKNELEEIQQSLKDNKDIPRFTNSSRSPKTDISSIDISPTDNGYKIGFKPTCINVLNNKRNELSEEYYSQKSIYGEAFVQAQKRITLPPLKIILHNDNISWLSAIIYMFENKMCILKLELPISDTPSSYLKNSTHDELIKDVLYEWEEQQVIGNTIQDIIDFYKNKLIKHCQTNIEIGKFLHHIMLADYESMPKQLNQMCDTLREEFYKIITAPVSAVDYVSYNEIAKEYMKTHAWGNHTLKYITNTQGGCLSSIDGYLLTWAQEKVNGVVDINTARECAIKTLRTNVDLCFIIIALKRTNIEYVIYSRATMPQNTHEIQKKYNANKIYIIELLNNVYGTVREQLEFFEKTMCYYVDNQLLEDKLDVLQKIQIAEEEHHKEKFQNFLSISGVALAIIFGLPAIYDTISILKRLMLFANFDVPYISVFDLSFIIWGVASVLFSRHIYKKIHKNKKKNKKL